MQDYLFNTSDVVSLYDSISASINTIWNIYVFVLLGMVGWILTRANEFRKVQKILITIIFTFFNVIIVFYFVDAYSDIASIRQELIALRETHNLSTVTGGISASLIEFNPFVRLWTSSIIVGAIWCFVIYLVWARKIWETELVV